MSKQQNCALEIGENCEKSAQINREDINFNSSKIQTNKNSSQHPFQKTLINFHHIFDGIRENFAFMNEQILERPEININKQIQDAICKYFFHNTVGHLLKGHFKLKSIREIAEKVFENNKEAQTVKLQYMKFLQCYTSQIRKFGITEEYHNFLWDIILADDTYSLRDLEFITELRKKMTAIIALTFSQMDDEKHFQSLFDIWGVIFPQNKLPCQQKNNQDEEEEEQEELAADEECKGDIKVEQMKNEQNIEQDDEQQTQDVRQSDVDLQEQKKQNETIGFTAGICAEQQHQNIEEDDKLIMNSMASDFKLSVAINQEEMKTTDVTCPSPLQPKKQSFQSVEDMNTTTKRRKINKEKYQKSTTTKNHFLLRNDLDLSEHNDQNSALSESQLTKKPTPKQNRKLRKTMKKFFDQQQHQEKQIQESCSMIPQNLSRDHLSSEQGQIELQNKPQSQQQSDQNKNQNAQQINSEPIQPIQTEQNLQINTTGNVINNNNIQSYMLQQQYEQFMLQEQFKNYFMQTLISEQQQCSNSQQFQNQGIYPQQFILMQMQLAMQNQQLYQQQLLSQSTNIYNNNIQQTTSNEQNKSIFENVNSVQYKPKVANIIKKNKIIQLNIQQSNKEDNLQNFYLQQYSQMHQ